MTLTLVKGCPINGGSYASNFATVGEQVSYINQYPFKRYNVNTTRLGEPIRLASSIADLIGYNYGYIDYGDGFYYFIAVNDVSMVTETQTEISYTIDCYETVCNQCNLTFNKAYLTKYPVQRGDVHLPNEPYYWAVNHDRSLMVGCSYIAVVSVENSDGTSRPQCYLINVTSSTAFDNVLRLEWVNHINPSPLKPILPSDIYMACVCPFPLVNISTTIWTDVTDSTASGYKIYHSAFAMSADMYDNLGFHSLSSTLYNRQEIRDMRNNPVWQCPVGHTFSVTSAELVATATACNVVIQLAEDTDIRTVTVPCEIVDIYDDSWKDYQSRQRESDKALRQINYNQQALSGIANSLNSGLSGAMAGGLSGAGGGLGAIAGVATGIIGTAGTWAINQYYDPKLQEQYDRQASRQVDNLLLAGNVTADMYVHNYAGVVTVSPDTRSLSQFEKEASTYGYSTVLYLDSDPRINGSNRVTGSMRGSVDISADCPSLWLNEIASRFNTGITFVR